MDSEFVCGPKVVGEFSVPGAVKVANGLRSEPDRDFPAVARLKRPAEFQRVYMHGRRVAGKHMVLFLVKTSGELGRFGVTASRRVGGSVVRARAKRRLRELYRLHRHEAFLLDHDIVANARRSTATARWAELEADFLSCLATGAKAPVRRHRPAAGGVRP